jgi:hypothetical protein
LFDKRKENYILEVEDNPYRIPDLLPDEFHELLSDYENSFAWRHKGMDERQQELAQRVLAKLRQAGKDHVCLDEVQEGGMTATEWAKPFLIVNLYRTDIGRLGLTREQVEALSNMDMLKIAQQLAYRYLESVFLAYLKTVVNDLLVEKENTA